MSSAIDIQLHLLMSLNQSTLIQVYFIQYEIITNEDCSILCHYHISVEHTGIGWDYHSLYEVGTHVMLLSVASWSPLNDILLLIHVLEILLNIHPILYNTTYLC